MSARKTRPPPIPKRDTDEKTSIYDSQKRKKPKTGAPIMQAISMKTPGAAKIAADEMVAEPALKRPKLRAMSEVTPTENQQLGYFAPPADPRHLRRRRARDLTLVVSCSIIVASVIALVIWFVAR
ncbi:MAG TPA: hypothetical protein VMJ10_09410 [Kofleriaceae bacterium]|nr:hypothetical protein [Kofleriaceae bacterium]